MRGQNTEEELYLLFQACMALAHPDNVIRGPLTDGPELDLLNAALTRAGEKLVRLGIAPDPDSQVGGPPHTLAWYVEQCHALAKAKGFHDEPLDDAHVAQKLMLIVSELGEALEAHRRGDMEPLKKNTFPDELADVFIRAFDLCGALGIDIEAQIQWKMAYNATRPHKHGKRY